MQYNADTPDDYIKQLPPDRMAPMTALRKVIKKNLPKGFEETISYGMIGYVVPHKLYPSGYHCDPKLPLPFMSIASQKHFIAVYHMGLYTDKKLMQWFLDEYPLQSSTKLDVGKSCIRFKKPDLVPIELIGDLASKMTVKDWIAMYEREVER